jgi:hypothetical protein
LVSWRQYYTQEQQMVISVINISDRPTDALTLMMRRRGKG